MNDVKAPIYLGLLIFIGLFLCSWVSLANSISIDTLDKNKVVKVDTVNAVKKKSYKIIPRVATLKSLMIPGWGQYYNRQYWKLPLVAGAFITLGLIADYNQVRYVKYRGYYYIASPHPEDPSYVPPATVAVPFEDGLIRDLDVNQLKRLNDGYRRNRDYTYIGMVLAWALNVVDANVSAHLKTFDVSDDITLKIKPNFEYQPNANGLYSGISLSFNFKK
ncbi:DUF5683 domain-containing protein [Aquirufa rosea]|uniref:DUF5683 domain-containing protein n=1 Tax=Aquirufa rosea TaxID=2509241 RepID=A0A4V1M5P3_9BACT|nr:DUF5683 domain-containing protein [Aquirufa rosea]RXK52112.1 hypothetical protein ESB04_00195 [Aquirufa rosea]